MVIKGAAHEITVYDQPWYAIANDLDIIIKMEPVEFKQCDRWELEDLKRDISLEEDFMVHHDVTMNNILPIDFGMIWDDASQIRFRDHDLFVMSPEDMLITSCINSCRKRYFRLKALFDIAEIINKFPDVNWADFVMKAKDYQVNKIIYTALWVTNETVGCAIPKTVFFDLDINPIRAQIIHRLIRKISTYSLMYPHSERRILKRRANLSIVLPYASYNLDQAIRKIGYVWSTR